MGKDIIILDVLAEGGGVTLHGLRHGSGWRFSLRSLDQTPLLIDEPSISTQSEVVDSWEGALELLDRYPWHRLSPRTVHPEFRALIWQAVQYRFATNPGRPHVMIRWKEECFGLPRDSLFGTNP